MDAICFAREGFEIRLKKDHVQKNNLYDFHLIAWYHYNNHVMGQNSNISKSSIVQYNLLSNYIGKNYVDRIIYGVRGVFLYQWYDTQIHYGADMQINQHRRKIMGDNWFQDSYFQNIRLFIELNCELGLFTKFVRGVRLEHTLANYYDYRKV